MKPILLLLIIVSLGAGSCHPEPDSKKLIDDFAVATNFDPAADFNSYATYAMPTDTIGLISETSSDTIIVARESDLPRPVLSAIKSNLDASGYTQVGRNENPDLGVNVLVVTDLNAFQQVIYPDFYYPGNYYYNYYGYSSWYYYPYVQTYAYNTGVLVIEIVDLKNRTADNRVKVVWNAYMGDVFNTMELIPQAERGILQAFAQSPYLAKNSL